MIKYFKNERKKTEKKLFTGTYLSDMVMDFSTSRSVSFSIISVIDGHMAYIIPPIMSLLPTIFIKSKIFVFFY